MNGDKISIFASKFTLNECQVLNAQLEKKFCKNLNMTVYFSDLSLSSYKLCYLIADITSPSDCCKICMISFFCF